VEELAQRLVDHTADGTQRVIGWYALICTDVAEHRGLVLVVASHEFFLPVDAEATREFSGTGRVFL